jgi:hypothetical protein
METHRAAMIARVQGAQDNDELGLCTYSDAGYSGGGGSFS